MTEKKPYSDRRWHEPIFTNVTGDTGEELTPEQKRNRRGYLKGLKKLFKEKYSKDVDITDLLKELDED